MCDVGEGLADTQEAETGSEGTMCTRFWRIIALLLALLVAQCSVDAQDATTSTADELQPVFNDDFSKDTRGDYTIAGDVIWEAGHLTLQPDASFRRSFKAGARVRVEMTLDWPELTKEQPESALLVWFGLQGTTGCFVLVYRELTEHGPTASVSLSVTGEEGGKLVPVLVREVLLDKAEVRQLAVEYRHGLVNVWMDEVDVITAHIPKRNAEVLELAAQVGPGMRLKFDHVSTTAVRPAAPMTAEHQQQLDAAKAANTRLIELYQKGGYSEAAIMGAEIVEIRTSILGPDHPDTAISLNNLASLYKSQANYAAAERLYQRTLEIREKSLGPDHPDTAQSLNNLADLYQSQANYAAAEPLLLRALEIKEKSLGPDHPDTAMSLNDLAFMYYSKSNHAAAEPLYQRALEIREKSLGPDHPNTSAILNNLALLQWEDDHESEAVSLVERALANNLRNLDAMAAIQTEQQQFLMSSTVGTNMNLWLTVSGADPQ